MFLGATFMLYLRVDRCFQTPYGSRLFTSYPQPVRLLSDPAHMCFRAGTGLYSRQCTLRSSPPTALKPYIPTMEYLEPQAEHHEDGADGGEVRRGSESRADAVPTGAPGTRWDTGQTDLLGGEDLEVELLLIIVVVLATTLAAGGALSYVAHRDRRSQTPTPEAQTVPRPPRRPTPGPASPGPAPALGTGSSGTPAATPDDGPPPGAPAQDAAQRRAGPPDGQEDADAAREALRANQRAMSDPRLSTLDRVQALIASQAFALHLIDQPTEPHTDDKRDPRD